MRKILEKKTKSWWKFKRFLHFWLQFLLKNHSLTWINGESPKIKILFFEGLGGGVKSPFFKTWGGSGGVGGLYKSLEIFYLEILCRNCWWNLIIVMNYGILRWNLSQNISKIANLHFTFHISYFKSKYFQYFSINGASTAFAF